MKSLLTKIAAVTFVSIFGLTWGTEQNLAQAESLQKVTIRISADIPPPPMPTSVAMEWFKKKVESEFPDGSKVRIYYAGALYKDPDAMTAMSQGNLEMGWLVAGKTAATDIWLSIPGQPGVLTTAGAVHDLINQPTGKMLQKRLRDKHNIEMFGFSDISFALGMAGKQRLLTLKTMKDKKIRTFAAGVNPTVSSWGASPVVMSFGDVPSALESGVIDGVITSIGGWRAITEQTPYYTVAGISTVAFDTYWVGASSKWMSKYNKTTQNKIRSLVNDTIAYQNKLNWCNDQFAINKYKTKDPSKPGIYQASAAEAAPLQKAIGTNVADFLKGKLPDEADAWVDRYLKDGKAASVKFGPGTDPVYKLDCSKYKDLLSKKKK
ncbi:MAG: TRAP transporter substrate-binding protein DctP [Alphaproteobacteria bacterium]|nr:TRAP transporter substrate-binding protein DctP [Alphaproteobacteria bacterium]